MDLENDRSHVEIGDVHHDGVIEEAKTPGPLVRDARGQQHQKRGDQQERSVEERERITKTGGVNEAQPGDEDEELEYEFVGKEVASD